MNQKKVTIVDAALIHPTLEEPIVGTQKLIEILRQQGRKLIFFGNEVEYTDAEYQASMLRLSLPSDESDQFMSGITFLAQSAQIHSKDKRISIFENGRSPLNQELQKLGVQHGPLDDDPLNARGLYIGALADFAYQDIRTLLQELDKPHTNLIAFCSQRIDHQRSATRILLQALAGQISISRNLVSIHMNDCLFDLAKACGFERSDEARPDQSISVVAFGDAEIYFNARQIRTKFTNADDPLFYVQEPLQLHDQATLKGLVLPQDKVPNLDTVIQKLENM